MLAVVMYIVRDERCIAHWGISHKTKWCLIIFRTNCNFLYLQNYLLYWRGSEIRPHQEYQKGRHVPLYKCRFSARNVCPLAFIFKEFRWILQSNSQRGKKHWWTEGHVASEQYRTSERISKLCNKSSNVTVRKKHCKVNPLCWRGRKGKASLLDAQVTNPWPLSSTLESLTSVCFSRLLPLPLVCKRNLIMAGEGMWLPKVTGFLRCLWENDHLTEQVWYINRMYCMWQLTYYRLHSIHALYFVNSYIYFSLLMSKQVICIWKQMFFSVFCFALSEK